MESRILTQKLKEARTRRCHMIFEGFCPDQDDTIYLSEIDEHFRYLHPDSVLCLKAFFKAFYAQTNRVTMNRKYFTANMLAALERNKFNVHNLFQDPDILELERRLLFCKDEYEIPISLKKDATEIYENQEIINRKSLEWQSTKQDILLNDSKVFSNESPQKDEIHNQAGTPDITQPHYENLKAFHTTQKQNRRKLQTYMKRHFGLEPELQKSMVDPSIEYMEGESLSVSLILKDQSSEKSCSNLLSHNQRKSVPFIEEVTWNHSTSRPKLYQHLRDAISKELKPKVYSCLREQKDQKNAQNMSKAAKLDTGSSQTPDTIRNTDSDPLSWRNLRKVSLETLANMNSMNFGSTKIAQIDERLEDSILLVQHIHHNSEKQIDEERLKRSPALENSNQVSINTNTTKTPQFSKIPENRKIYNAKLNKERNKNQSLSSSQSQQGKNIAVNNGAQRKMTSSRSTRQNSKNFGEMPSSTLSERTTKKVPPLNHNSNKDVNPRKSISNHTPIKASLSNSFSKSDKNASLSDFERKSVHDTRLGSNSAFGTPLKKETSYYIKKNNPLNEFSDPQKNNNKENNYNFSFTEREIVENYLQ